MRSHRADAQPDSPERAAAKAAITEAFTERMLWEHGAAHGARLLFAPAELLVPLVRLARGRTGAALAPAAVGQVNAVLAASAVRVLRRRGYRLQQRDRWALLASAVWCLATPALAAGTERAVVLRGRSPLWGYLLQMAATLPVSLSMAASMLVVIRSAAAEHRRATTAVPAATDP